MEAAYIIGGFYTLDIVAEFRDNKWTQVGSLNKGTVIKMQKVESRDQHNLINFDDPWKGRRYHGSISVGAETMIVGGYTADRR